MNRRLGCAAAVLSAALLTVTACSRGNAPLVAPARTGPPSTSAMPSATLPPGSPAEAADEASSRARITAAIGQMDQLVAQAMKRTAIPGMSVAIVHDGKLVYAKGFGVRKVGDPARVDADTVFQLSSLSKPIGATVVAAEIGRGTVSWQTPVARNLPGFALADPYVSSRVTIADMYAHRSGLPAYAGDRLEDLGFPQAEILQRLRYFPLAPFRGQYLYTDFGLTAAAESVAAAAKTSWAQLSDRDIYLPLNMLSTSSTYAGYLAQPDRAVGHVKVAGSYRPSAMFDPDAQSPASGVSSSANDLAKWMMMVLAGGANPTGDQVADPQALLAATSPQITSMPPTTSGERAIFYGYGFGVNTGSAGRVLLHHSGAFEQGASANFLLIPSLHLGIAALSNAAPTGAPEAVTASFADLAQSGKVQRDWLALYQSLIVSQPTGALVGKKPPANPRPAAALSHYVGSYHSPIYGPARITHSGNRLTLTVGPKQLRFPLTHWDGDEFTFVPTGESAPPGSLSALTFTAGAHGFTAEYFNQYGLGAFTR